MDIKLVHEVKENQPEIKHNPWAVENVSVFLKYHCPECQFINNDLKMFTDHALANHEDATALFSTEVYEEPDIKMEIVENCVYCGFNECSCWNNETQNEVQTNDAKVDLGSIEAYSNHMNNPKKCSKSTKKETRGRKKKPKEKKPWDIESQILCDICPINEFSSMNAVLAHRFVSFTYCSIDLNNLSVDLICSKIKQSNRILEKSYKFKPLSYSIEENFLKSLLRRKNYQLNFNLRQMNIFP